MSMNMNLTAYERAGGLGMMMSLDADMIRLVKAYGKCLGIQAFTIAHPELTDADVIIITTRNDGKLLTAEVQTVLARKLWALAKAHADVLERSAS